MNKIIDTVYKYVGVLVLTENNRFKEIKPAKENPNLLDKQLLMNSLKKEEYTELVRLLGFDVPEVANSELFTVCSRFVKGVDEKKIKSCFTKLLKETRANKESLIKKLPKSLTNAVISYRFSKKTRKRVN